MFCEQASEVKWSFQQNSFSEQTHYMFEIFTNLCVFYFPNIKFWRCTANFSFLALTLKLLGVKFNPLPLLFLQKIIFRERLKPDFFAFDIIISYYLPKFSLRFIKVCSFTSSFLTIVVNFLDILKLLCYKLMVIAYNKWC